MKKRRIVIASILKPVDDTRMWEKMATSLAETDAYEVFVVGFPGSSITAKANIHVEELALFSRISLGRALARWKVFGIVREVKPQILIVNTHELLIVAIMARILFGTKIIYDIRENYYRNIRYSEAFPPPFRRAIAGWVRLKEKLTSQSFHHFLLAESAYREEMSFFKQRYTIIENKAAFPTNTVRSAGDGKIRLLFSGTLAESTGVFEAIDLARKLHELNDKIRLQLVGHCAMPGMLQQIIIKIRGLDYIQLRGGDQLVPHAEIIDAIFASDFGIISYPASPHTENSLPTKLYEYLAGKLPILLQSHPRWLAQAQPFHACVAIDFADPDPKSILDQMSGPFYTTSPTGVTWASEAPKLISVLEKI